MATLTTQNLHSAAVLAAAIGSGAASTLVCTNAGASSVVLAFGFVCPKIMASGRLNDIRFYVSAVSGSPTVTAELYSNSASNTPGTLIETGSVTCSPTGAGFWTCSGFTATSNLTEGTQYWIVLSCTAGTSVTINWIASTSVYAGLALTSGLASATYGCLKVHSTDNKATWGGTATYGVTGWRLSFTDGTDTIYFGLPVINLSVANAATEKLYTNAGNVQEFGSLFTMPANVTFKMRSVAMHARKALSPTGTLRCRLYTGTTLTATSVAIPAVNIITGGFPQYRFEFSTPQTLSPGVAYRIVLGNSADDDASNYFYTYKQTLADDATDRSLMPFATIQSTKLSGSSWTDLDTEFVPFALIGDTDGAFVAGGGGGAPVFGGSMVRRV